MAEHPNFYAKQTTVSTTTGTSWVSPTNDCKIAAASISANTKYLVIAKAVWGGDDNGDMFDIRIHTADDIGLDSQSLAVIEPTYETTGEGKAYWWVGSYTSAATPTDIGFQFRVSVGTGTVWIDQMVLVLTEWDGDFMIEAEDAGGTLLGTNTWGNVTAQIGSGAQAASTEYLVLGCQQIDVDDTKTNFHVALFGDIDADDTEEQLTYHSAEGEDVSEWRMVGVMGRVLTDATPSQAIWIASYADATNDYREGYSYLVAIDVSAFAKFQYAFSASGENRRISVRQVSICL
jgi:hypothetical protein